GSEVYVSTWIGGVYKLTTTTLAKGSNTVNDIGTWESLGMSGIEVSSIMVDDVEKVLYAGTSSGMIYKSKDGVTSTETEENIPEKFSLSQNFPNPFNPSTVIEYSIPEAGLYSLRIYNILGQEVAVLVNRNLNPGSYTVNFDASSLTSGMYLYKLIGEKVNITKKMILLK
ncbi:MAG: T9SS type A sorting domain-containing protein, partial [Melioribacteraceae bacterium]|nr:T9SS type A sorting domain-containing protein [Melioribacteraceae bacterium]